MKTRMKLSKRIIAMMLVVGMIASNNNGISSEIKAKQGSKKNNYKILKEIGSEKENTPIRFEKEKIASDNKKAKYIVFSNDSVKEKLKEKYKEKKLGGYMENENVTLLSITGKEAKEIQKKSGVLHIEKDTKVEGCSEAIGNRKIVKKKYVNHQATWNKEVIKVKDEESDSQEKVKVAILDSGLDFGNDVKVEKQINLVPGEEDLTPLFIDSTGHATSVAGIIAAEDNGKGITGINPNVEIYSAKILDDNNTAPISRVVEAIYWAMEQDVNIINISFSTPNHSQILEKAIKDAYNHGILIVAAAGNGETVEYPAAYTEVMAVGSVDSEGIVSDNSGKGKELEIVAPGEKVTSTALLGGVANVSGTSLAVPHVVGVASLLWQKDLSMSNKFIRDLLDYSANGYGEEDAYGNGLVDYEYACAIYDEFKETYNALKENPIEGETIEENTSKCIVFEDNTAVEGKWGTSLHEDMAAMYTSVKYFQKGAQAPDKLDGLNGLKENHAWHGGRFCNYVADYSYIVRVAEAVGSLDKDAALSNIKNKINSVSKQVGMDSYPDEKLARQSTDYANGVYADMKSDLNKYVASELVGLTKAQKRAYMYGIASHIATDVYSHASFRYTGSNWVYIEHVKDKDGNFDKDSKLYTDNPKCVPRRFEAATAVMNKIVSRYEGNRSGVSLVRDFWIDDLDVAASARDYYNSSKIKFTLSSLNSDATFRLANLKSYMNSAGETTSKYLTAYDLVTKYITD